MIGRLNRAGKPVMHDARGDIRFTVPGERGPWLDRHDLEAQATLAVLVGAGRTAESVACLEAHVARTAEVRDIVHGAWPEWAVAVVRLAERRGPGEVAAVRLLMFDNRVEGLS